MDMLVLRTGALRREPSSPERLEPSPRRGQGLHTQLHPGIVDGGAEPLNAEAAPYSAQLGPIRWEEVAPRGLDRVTHRALRPSMTSAPRPGAVAGEPQPLQIGFGLGRRPDEDPPRLPPWPPWPPLPPGPPGPPGPPWPGPESTESSPMGRSNRNPSTRGERESRSSTLSRGGSMSGTRVTWTSSSPAGSPAPPRPPAPPTPPGRPRYSEVSRAG